MWLIEKVDKLRGVDTTALEFEIVRLIFTASGAKQDVGVGDKTGRSAETATKPPAFAQTLVQAAGTTSASTSTMVQFI